MWYSAGTVAVTANSATVTGTGTAFSANVRVGDAFIGPDLGLYEVTNIASATVLSIRPNYQGATASGQAYAIAPMQGYVKDSADRLRQITDQFGTILADLGENGPSIKVDAAGLLADRAAYDGRSAGFAYYATDTELLYIKLGGAADAWSLGAPVAVGPAGPTGDVTPEALQARDDAQAAAVAASDSASTAAQAVSSAQGSAQSAADSASSANSSASGALASEQKAEQWAENAEDLPVEQGQFSAKHHAIKAGASAASAAGSASAASTSATNASGSADSAASSAGSASQSATDAAASAGVATTKAGESASSASTAEQHSLAAQQAADAVAAIGAGWTPVIANVSDGERIVMQVTDWTGGEANKPAVGMYVGPSGFVATAAEATNIRPQGGGTVESVNGVLPDGSGNIDLSASDVGAIAEGDTAYDSARYAGLLPPPEDGKQYALKDGAWVEVEASGGSAPLGFRLLKTTSTIPAWAKSGAGLITAQALTYTLDGAAHELPGGTAISLPALTAGNDYAIYATTDGRLVADLNWSAPSGEPAGTTRKIGGFHVALTGEIFEYSLWDINYRPTCPDPRGMVCINGMFWADIYLLGVNHHIDGTSRAGVTIADGASPPKIPAIYGGNGSTAYGSLTWFETQDVLQSHGKRCPSWAEFSMLAFGAAEATAVGVDPVTTKHDAPRRSRWGVEQATGNLWVWGAETQGNSGGGWAAITGGRGSVFHSGCTAVLLGAHWADGADSGSRSASWYSSPSSSAGHIGGRGLSDHLRLLAER